MEDIFKGLVCVRTPSGLLHHFHDSSCMEFHLFTVFFSATRFIDTILLKISK